MSTVASLRVLLDDPTPPYEQLRRQLADLIGSGAIAEGERLPPVRQLAADLGLAAGTVARTYRELEAAGLVGARRGGGTRVRSVTRRPAPELRQELDAHVREMVRRARQVGASDAEIRDAVDLTLRGDS